MNTKLQNFLIDDVRALIVAIRNDEKLAAYETPYAQFDSLEDFANYWECHIDSINPETTVE